MTNQVMDTVVLDGKKHHLNCGFYLPKKHPLITELEEMPEGTPRILRSTACWRRYLAHWLIDNDQLYLCSIEGLYRKECDEPIEATWVSGEFTTVGGEVTDDKPSQFHHMYKLKDSLTFNEGRLVKREAAE